MKLSFESHFPLLLLETGEYTVLLWWFKCKLCPLVPVWTTVSRVVMLFGEVVDPLRGRTSSLEEVGYQGQWPNEVVMGSSSCQSHLLLPDARGGQEGIPQVPAASDSNQAGLSLHAFPALTGYNLFNSGLQEILPPLRSFSHGFCPNNKKRNTHCVYNDSHGTIMHCLNVTQSKRYAST